MRTLAKELVENGAGDHDRLDLGEELIVGDLRPAEAAAPRPQPSAQQVREVKRDRALARMAGLILDVARTVEPLVDLISARLLRWAALAASVGLAFTALRAPAWEKLAVVAVFMLLAPLLWRKSP